MNETLRTIHSLRTIHGDFSEREVSAADLTTIEFQERLAKSGFWWPVA